MTSIDSSADAGRVEVAQQAGHRLAGARHPAADVPAVDLDVVADGGELVAGHRDLLVAGDLEGDQVAGDVGLEVVGGVAGHDLAAVDDDDPVGEGVGLVEVVRGQEDRRALLAAQPRDVLPEVGAGLRVEAGGRLVEEDQRRRVDQPHHDVEAALLAAGHVLGHPPPEPVELELVEQLLALGHGVLAGHPVEHPVVDDLVAGVGAGERRADLGAVADAAPDLDRLRWPRRSRPPGGAGGRREQRDQHPQRGGLAGAVGAEEADHLALGHVEVDAVDGVDLLLLLALSRVEGLHESSCLDHRARAIMSPRPLVVSPVSTPPPTANHRSRAT